MKLALVCLDREEPDPPLGIAYIASYIRKYSDFDNIVIVDKEDPIKRIKKEKPDIVGISSMTHEFHLAKKLAEEIKTRFDVPIIIGGYHISLLPHHIAGTKFDIGVLGEGEQTMTELLRVYEKYGKFSVDKIKKVSGIVFQSGKSIKITERRPLIEPLDSIPYPARDLLKMKEYYMTIRKAMFGRFGIHLSMITSRGCPYKCVFCCNTQFWQRARFHSPEYVVGEIKELIEKYKADGIILFDDLFIANKKRVEEIADLVSKEKINEKVEFHIYGRANLIDEKICMVLKKMNVTVVEFGLESGSDKILSYLKRGTVTVNDNRRALRLCKKFGFKTAGSFITGSPNETEEDLKLTLSLLNDKNLDIAHVYQLTPLPGTEIWKLAKKYGMVSDDPTFNFEQLLMRKFKPNIILTKEIDEEKYRKIFFRLYKEGENKRYKVKISEAISGLGIKHLPQFLRPRFMKKLLFHWRDNLKYVKTSIGI
jgi:radical SAM superfamily enzyme YgiQ (UPF0313 family)